MKTKSTQNDLQLADPSAYATILMNWSRATSTFFCHYNKLAPCVNKRYIQEGLSSIKSRNPVPVNKLRELLSKMKHELKKLLQDLDQTQANNLSCSKANYKQLIAHTRVLNRLNREAEEMTFLTTLDIN